MIYIRIVCATVMPCVLAACASKELPQIQYDTEDFTVAAIEQEPARPVKVVTVAEPLPLPGQLKPLPAAGKVKTVDKRPPEEQVQSANKAATVMPQTEGYINAVQVYPYTEGALYQLYTAPGQISDIALQAGEEIVSVSAGDTARWVIGDTVSGSGAVSRAHILVKPIKADIKTNLIILTNRRSYHLDLVSTKETYMAAVSWVYPHDELIALQQRNKQTEAAAGQVIANGLDVSKLRFRYEISGDMPPWRPVRVFDDTHKVYIQFPVRLDQGEAPPLFVLGSKGKAQLVNYRVKGSTYIVDRLFAAAELRLGEDPQQVVRITRKGAGK